MLLRHKDVREAAHDWKTFSSDAPFRVPIPSEEAVRAVRQLPIETNPPDHTEYRRRIEPFFNRLREVWMQGQIHALIEGGGVPTAHPRGNDRVLHSRVCRRPAHLRGCAALFRLLLNAFAARVSIGLQPRHSDLFRTSAFGLRTWWGPWLFGRPGRAGNDRRDRRQPVLSPRNRLII
jgi:hypothetical protein